MDNFHVIAKARHAYARHMVLFPVSTLEVHNFSPPTSIVLSTKIIYSDKPNCFHISFGKQFSQSKYPLYDKSAFANTSLVFPEDMNVHEFILIAVVIMLNTEVISATNL